MNYLLYCYKFKTGAELVGPACESRNVGDKHQDNKHNSDKWYQRPADLGMGTPETLDPTYIAVPTGGLRSPMVRLITIIRPN